MKLAAMRKKKLKSEKPYLVLLLYVLRFVTLPLRRSGIFFGVIFVSSSLGVQLQARQAAKREAAEGHAADSLREQLDQSLRRLSDAQNSAVETTRYDSNKTPGENTVRTTKQTGFFVFSIDIFFF